MSYLEVGEDMHKLASHVVDSVSWNPCFFGCSLGVVRSAPSFFVGEVISGPIPHNKWTAGPPKWWGFLGKWHLLLITGADFQVAPRFVFLGSLFGVHFLLWGKIRLKIFGKELKLVIYWDLLKSWSTVGKSMSLCYVTCFPVLCLAGPKLFIFLWGVVLESMHCGSGILAALKEWFLEIPAGSWGAVSEGI